MRFKFCGDLDAPDFLLKEIDTLSKISVVRIKLIVAAIVKGLVGDEIDVKHIANFDIEFIYLFIYVFSLKKSILLCKKAI
jgi:hypothetical protein